MCSSFLPAIIVALQGTLKVEVPLATGVSGVVTRDAKGGGQGMITITDGNNLEMPAEVKFPKVKERNRTSACRSRCFVPPKPCAWLFQPRLLQRLKVKTILAIQNNKEEAVSFPEVMFLEHIHTV